MLIIFKYSHFISSEKYDKISCEFSKNLSNEVRWNSMLIINNILIKCMDSIQLIKHIWWNKAHIYLLNCLTFQIFILKFIRLFCFDFKTFTYNERVFSNIWIKFCQTLLLKLKNIQTKFYQTYLLIFGVFQYFNFISSHFGIVFHISIYFH